MFVLLENLKHTFAIERGYPFTRGHFRDASGRTKSFEKLLKEMFNVVGMYPDLTKIIKLRNETIHSGMSTLNMNEKEEIYINSHNLFREYFLRLLNYKGEYLLIDKDLPSVI